MTRTGGITDKLLYTSKNILEKLQAHALIGFFVTLVILLISLAFLFGADTIFEGNSEKIYQISWEEKSAPEIAHSHELLEKDILTIENEIKQKNLTTIQFELFWEDNRDGVIRNLSDMITMKIDPPFNTQTRFQDPNPSKGYISPLLATAAVNNIPDGFTLSDMATSEVSSQLNKYSSTNGVGTWKITLSIDASPPLDRGNNICLIITYDYYEPVIEEVT